MTQEVVNYLGMDTVLDLLESSLKHFELDVVESFESSRHVHANHDGDNCFLKKSKVQQQNLPPRAPHPDVKVTTKKKQLNKIISSTPQAQSTKMIPTMPLQSPNGTQFHRMETYKQLNTLMKTCKNEDEKLRMFD